MDFGYLIKGLVIGFSIAAPVGPIGVLCIRRTLAEGLVPGILTGLGAATADMLYGFVAGFGLTFISSLLTGHQIWIRLAGGLFLCYLGIKTFLAMSHEHAASARGNGLFGAYASTFFLTLTNPMTILSFAAIFAGLGLTNTSGNYLSAWMLVLGIFTGSAIWWLILSGSVGVFRERFNHHGLRWVNRISGIVVSGFGLIAIMN